MLLRDQIMENTRKMILIDPSVIEKLKHKESTSEDPLSRLDQEMQNILVSKLGDHEKWKLYSQILQRYLYFSDEGRRPIKLPLLPEETYDSNSMIKKENSDLELPNNNPPTTKKDVSESLIYDASNLIKVIPKSFKKKGELLVNALINNKNIIKWDEQGTVFIEDEAIPGSNIIDLLNDTLRQLKRPKPRGWEQFSKALIQARVPLFCIGNPTTAEYMRKLCTDDFTPLSEDTPKSAQPQRKKIKRKIDWERWTPY